MSTTRMLFAAALASLSLAAAGLKPGMAAPPFSAQDQDGRTVKLADFAGKSTVVLYFYPKDDTPGCTKEACSLRDGFAAIKAKGAVILGVSADDVKSHAAFSEKYHLPFPILADPGHAIIDAYGVRMPVMGIAKRVTFIIGRDGVIREILYDVKAAEHDQQVLRALASL
jgi:thioredoxin-dependent peroxiredoxin